MITNIKLKDGQACGNSLISLSLCRQFCRLFNLVTLLLQVQINSFFFFKFFAVTSWPLHTPFLPNPPQRNCPFPFLPLVSFNHLVFITIQTSLAGLFDWRLVFFVVVFFRRKPYRHGDTGPLLTEIQTHLPRSILTITFDPNMAPVTAISDGGWWSKTSQERRQCTEVSYEKCRVWAKSESKQQQLWGKNKKNVSTSHWAIAPS